MKKLLSLLQGLSTLLEKFRPLLLPAAAGVLLVLTTVFFVCWLRERSARREAQRQLEVQKMRVLVRKNKIMELRGQLRTLRLRLDDSESKLLGSFTPEEIRDGYEEVAQSLRALLKCADGVERGVSGRGSLMTAAAELSGSIKTAFRMKEDMVLEEPAAEDSTENSGIRGRVLVVDDNELNRELCVDLMETSGFLVDQAENGEEAVEKFRRSREGFYDVILMDVMMPLKNGYEACREIRKLFRSDSERVPIIAVTANSFSEDYVQLQDAGMNDRIVKPVNHDVLLSMVNKWLHYDMDEALPTSSDLWGSLPASESVKKEADDSFFL